MPNTPPTTAPATVPRETSLSGPRLGDAIRGDFALDPNFLTVNHGSYGAVPHSVAAVQAAWCTRMEAQPTRFMMRTLPGALREAASALADFIGAEAQDVVFVDNATTGCNAVLQSFDLRPGDEVLVLDHGYGAVVKTVRHITARVGARMITARTPFPDTQDEAVVDAIAAAITPRTRLAVIDHITSPSALVLPVAAIAALCRRAGVALLVDGAHAPGNIDLDVPATGADWYTGNCHKWLCAPRGSAFLWARRDRQAGLHPTVISHGYGSGFLAEFDWTGTRDPSAALSVPEAIAYHAGLGGQVLRARNAALAAEAASRLAAGFGTAANHQPKNACAMSIVRLPTNLPVDEDTASALRSTLLNRGTDVPVVAIGGNAWIRLSAAAYNELSHFDQLFKIVSEVLATASVAEMPQP